MEQIQVNPYDSRCASRQVIELIGDKWSLLIIPALIDGALRNSDLMRRIDGISQKMLTQTLKKLSEHNLIERHDFGEVPPRVAYSLTELGRSLVGIIAELDQWVIDNFYAMKA